MENTKALEVAQKITAGAFSGHDSWTEQKAWLETQIQTAIDEATADLRTQLSERDELLETLRDKATNAVNYLTNLICEGEEHLSYALAPLPVFNGDAIEMKSPDKVTANRINLRLNIMRRVADELHAATRQPAQIKEPS